MSFCRFTPGLLFASSLVLLSCSQDDKKSEAADSPCAAENVIVADASYNSLWSNVFSSRCGVCHGVAGNKGTENGPDLRSKDSFRLALVGKTIKDDYADWSFVQDTRTECLDIPLIKANSSGESLVVAVLDPASASALPNGCRVKNHLETPQSVCLSKGSLASLKKWIDNGAGE